jgi:cytochrome P450
MTPTDRDEPGTEPTSSADDPFAFKNQFYGGDVEDFYRTMDEVREACPARRGSVSSIFGLAGVDTMVAEEWAQMSVLGYAEVDEVLRSPATFSSTPLYDTLLRGPVGETILGMDPPRHRRYRELLQSAFTRREMERWEEEFVVDIVHSYLDPLVGRGRADLASEFAFSYPINVTAVAMGIPVDDFEAFYGDATLITNAGVAEDLRLAASERLGTIVGGLIDERRSAPKDDVISALIRAEVRDIDDPDRRRLTDEEIISFARLLVPAGAQTTYRALINLLFGLLTHPDQLEAVRLDRSLVPQAIEEGLRWEVPLTMILRSATGPSEVGGCPVLENDVVNVSLGTANRDPSRWTDPNAFDIFRPALGHQSFGNGPHLCLGIHMARMELRVALNLVLDLLPNVRLDGDQPAPSINGLVLRGAYELPVVWDVPSDDPES